MDSKQTATGANAPVADPGPCHQGRHAAGPPRRSRSERYCPSRRAASWGRDSGFVDRMTPGGGSAGRPARPALQRVEPFTRRECRRGPGSPPVPLARGPPHPPEEQDPERGGDQRGASVDRGGADVPQGLQRVGRADHAGSTRRFHSSPRRPPEAAVPDHPWRGPTDRSSRAGIVGGIAGDGGSAASSPAIVGIDRQHCVTLSAAGQILQSQLLTERRW